MALAEKLFSLSFEKIINFTEHSQLPKKSRNRNI